MAQIISPNEVQAGKPIRFFLDPGMAIFESGKWRALNGTVTGTGQFADINTTIDMSGSLLDIVFEWKDSLGNVSFANKTVQIINDPFIDAHVWYDYSNDYRAPSSYGNNWDFKLGTNIPTPYKVDIEYTQKFPQGHTWGPYKTTNTSFTSDVRAANKGNVNVSVKTTITKDGISKTFIDECYGVINSTPSDSLVKLSLKTEDDNRTFKVGELIQAAPVITTTSSKVYSIRYVWELKKGSVTYDKISTNTFSESALESGAFTLICKALLTNVEDVNEAFVLSSSIPITVEKITDWVPTVRFIGNNGHPHGVEWGPLDAMQLSAFVSNGDKLISDIGVVAGSVSTWIDGVEIISSGSSLAYELYNQRVNSIGTHRIKFKGKAASVSTNGMPIANGVYGVVDFESQEYPYSVGKLSKLTTYSMMINGVSIRDNVHPIDLSGPPGKEFTFQCSINLDAPNTTTGVNTDLKALSLKGVFSLIDYKGDTVIESPTGSGTIKWTFPNEIKTLTGKLRWVCMDPSVVAPMMFENDLRIGVYKDLPEVMPTLNISQTPGKVKIGDTATVTAVVDKGVVSNIKWNGIASQSMQHNTVAARGKQVTFSCTTTVEGYDPIEMYQVYPLDVIGKSWDGVVLTLSADKSPVEYATNVVITPTLKSGATTLTLGGMTWFQDDVEIQSQVQSKLIFQTHKIGNHVYKCEGTITNIDYEPQTKTFVETIEVPTVNATINTTCVISPKPVRVKIGEHISYGVKFSNLPVGAEIIYSWKKNGIEVSTESVYDFTGDVEGDVEITMDAVISGFGIETLNVKDTTKVSVMTELPENNDLNYVHPLDHRGAGFIWCGYWVLDLIQNAVKSNIDWRHPEESNLPYVKDLKTIADMIVRYPVVEIQESRNGCIVGKEQIEEGKIYNPPFQAK